MATVSTDFIIGLTFNLLSLAISLLTLWQSQKMITMMPSCKLVYKTNSHDPLKLGLRLTYSTRCLVKRCRT